MRCRKVRSLLSAACSDELGGRQQVSVREHLASCPSCRKEASYYSSIRQAVRDAPGPKLSEDFDARLLNKIAEERFAETRTRAYLPKAAPRIVWYKLVPVAVAAALVALVAVNLTKVDQPMPVAQSTTGPAGHMDDRYLTVLPTDNPNVTVGLDEDWTLAQRLARTERLEQISRSLTHQSGFGNQHLASGTARSQYQLSVPVPRWFLMRRPAFRVYRVVPPTVGTEDTEAY